MLEAWARAVVLVAAVCAGLWHPAAQAEAPLHITTAQTLVVPGHGYSPPPYRADEAELQGHWEAVALPHALPRQLIPEAERDDARGPPTVVTWYRMRFAALPASAEARHLYVSRWKTDGQIAVYADGRLVYQSHANVLWNGANIPLWIALDATAPEVALQTVLVRIESPRDAGGGISSIWLGPENGLSWRYRLRYLLQVQLPSMSSAAFLAVGLFSLFAWFRWRSETVFLLFFCMSVASYLHTLHFHVGQGKLPISDEWFTWLTVNSLYWMLLVTHYFFNDLHRRPLRWLNRIANGVTVVVGIVTLPAFSGWLDAYALSPLAYMVLLALGAVVAGTGVRQSRRAWSRDGLLLSCWRGWACCWAHTTGCCKATT